MPCAGGYTPPWTNGVVAIPASTQIAISYVVWCVSGGTTVAKQFGVATFDTVTKTFVSNATAVFVGSPLDRTHQLGNPVLFDDGTGPAMYFTADDCTSTAFGACGAGTLKIARVALVGTRPWETAASYRWWTGSTWSTDPAAAVNDVSGITPIDTSIMQIGGLPGGPFVLLEEPDIAGGFRAWTAPTPTGPWTLRRSDLLVPDCGTGTGLDLCRAIIGHSELSIAGASSTIAYSAFRPSDQKVCVGWFTL